MEVVQLEILQTWYPSLKNQEELKKVMAVYEAFKFLPEERITAYGEIAREISEMHDHGEADITIQIRGKQITNEMYGKRKVKI